MLPTFPGCKFGVGFWLAPDRTKPFQIRNIIAAARAFKITNINETS